MILTLMLIILTATLVIVIIGFVMDRMEMTKLKSGMRTLNKRIKGLEKKVMPFNYTVFATDESTLEKQAIDELSKLDMEDVTYGAVDTKTDSETETADGGDISLETDDTIQTTGD